MVGIQFLTIILTFDCPSIYVATATLKIHNVRIFMHVRAFFPPLRRIKRRWHLIRKILCRIWWHTRSIYSRVEAHGCWYIIDTLPRKDAAASAYDVDRTNVNEWLLFTFQQVPNLPI